VADLPQRQPGPVRVAIRVKPGARLTRVGGAHGASGALVVAVQARAVDGKATEAALRALAAALGVPRRSVSLVSGATARDKVVELRDPPDGLEAALEGLRSH
jgi:uncharacterized protein